MSGDLISALTVDVEDYFQVSGFEDVIPRESWDSFDSRIERNTDTLLAILADQSVTATFFVLGWTAERHPKLIRRIQAAGHEVACHSYAHRLVYQCTPTEFREDTRHAKALLEDLAGKRVIGYRAPSFSITQESLWALEILAEEGFEYDSSIFPILRDRYGIPSAPRYPYHILLGNSQSMLAGANEGEVGPNSWQLAAGSGQQARNCYLPTARLTSSLPHNASCQLPAASSPDSIVEFPPSTIRYLGFNFPVGGGGYLRLYPESLFQRAIRRILENEKQPALLYIHPWELDPGQPRFQNGSRLSRFRQYINLQKTEARLRSLLTQWRFSSIPEVLSSLHAIPSVTLQQLNGRTARRPITT